MKELNNESLMNKFKKNQNAFQRIEKRLEAVIKSVDYHTHC